MIAGTKRYKTRIKSDSKKGYFFIFDIGGCDFIFEQISEQLFLITLLSSLKKKDTLFFSLFQFLYMVEDKLCLVGL